LGDQPTTAHLGTGRISQPFSGHTILLPGPVARTQRLIRATGTRWRSPTSVCPDGNSSYPIQRTAGLRDINGDGIPDYVSGHQPP
jgi:hypothetical protein